MQSAKFFSIDELAGSITSLSDLYMKVYDLKLFSWFSGMFFHKILLVKKRNFVSNKKVIIYIKEIVNNWCWTVQLSTYLKFTSETKQVSNPRSVFAHYGKIAIIFQLLKATCSSVFDVLLILAMGKLNFESLENKNKRDGFRFDAFVSAY